MEPDRLLTYDDVIKSLNSKKRQKHLLLGNGFSMSYDSSIFSYNALSKFLENLQNGTLQKLFQIIKTCNFELIMEQLDNVAQISEVFGADETVVKEIKQASELLKESLIDAIKELHPAHVFSIPEEKSKACAAFLNSYLAEGGSIFTTNYDLLLYWVIMRNVIENSIDGFGRDAEDNDEWIPPEERNYSELRWGKYKKTQTVHYLHGALQLFDTGLDVIKEEYTNHNFLLDNIKARMAKKEYPIFVTAGNGYEKLTHIVHNKYLAYSYDSLSSIGGSLICYGFGFGNYDEHIIDAINKAAKKRKDENDNWLPFLASIYIGVYSEADLKHIESIRTKFKLPVRLFDAKTVNVWC